MGQVFRNLILTTMLFIIIFPSWAIANDRVIPSNNSDTLPKVFEYSGEYNSNLNEELINNDSPDILYNGKTFREAGRDFTYLLWNATAQFTATVNAADITIQFKNNEYDSGYIQIYVDSNYLGEINTKGIESKYLRITNLEYIKHRVILKQRGGHVNFAWIGFGDKKGDIQPPATTLSYSPELVSGFGGTDTEISFLTEDDINEEIEPSGIAKTLYSIDGDSWVEYQGPFTLGKGEHQIRYYSIDNNKNHENIKLSNVMIKSVAPEVAYK